MSMIVRPSTKEDIDYLYTVIEKDRLDEWMGERQWYLALERNWRIAEDKGQDVFLMSLGMLHRDDHYSHKCIFRTGGATMMFRQEAHLKYGITYVSADFPISIDEAAAIIRNIWISHDDNLSGWKHYSQFGPVPEYEFASIRSTTFFMLNTQPSTRGE